MSSVPPELRAGSVDSLTRHEDSPPRICGPKLFVSSALQPSSAAAVMIASPADTMPSPPEPAMPITRSLLIRFYLPETTVWL
jgi:hypothetical protein